MEFQEIISKKNGTKMRHIVPSFGSWECHNVHDFPIAQYLGEQYFFKEANSDLFQAPPTYIVHHHKKELDYKNKKQGKVWQFGEVTHHHQQPKKERTKAVDEDLYEIPHEFLYHNKPKRGMVANDFWRRCFGLSCIP